MKTISEFSAKYPKKDKRRRLKIEASQRPMYIPQKVPKINENIQNPLSEALNNVLSFENIKKSLHLIIEYPS